MEPDGPTPAPTRARPGFWQRLVAAKHAWDWYLHSVPHAVAFLVPVVLFPVPTLLALPDGWAAALKVLSVSGLAVVALDAALLLGFATGLGATVTVATVLYTELLLLIWLVRNLAFLRLWGPTGRFLAKREVKARASYERRAWVKRSHMLGVMVFVFLPLNSGIITGVFMGKLTGLSDRRTLVAVYTGTILWVSLLATAIALSIEFLLPWLTGEN